MKVVITGARRGIGAGLAQAYRAAGHDVVGAGRSADCDTVLDVTDQGSHAAFAATLGAGAIDLLICNAGVFLDREQTIEEGYDASLWAETFAANVTGVFLTVQSLLPHVRRAARPKVAIISSQMGSSARAKGNGLIYRASKAAVSNLGCNLAEVLRPEGIAVGIYHPGWVRTDMGGGEADISVAQSVDGLMARFEHLSLETTACFEAYDGRPIPF